MDLTLTGRWSLKKTLFGTYVVHVEVQSESGLIGKHFRRADYDDMAQLNILATHNSKDT